VTAGPNPDALGRVVANHLGPLLYALETCALTMEQAGRQEEATYYRALAGRLAEAGGSSQQTSTEPRAGN